MPWMALLALGAQAASYDILLLADAGGPPVLLPPSGGGISLVWDVQVNGGDIAPPYLVDVVEGKTYVFQENIIPTAMHALMRTNIPFSVNVTRMDINACSWLLVLKNADGVNSLKLADTGSHAVAVPGDTVVYLAANAYRYGICPLSIEGPGFIYGLSVNFISPVNAVKVVQQFAYACKDEASHRCLDLKDQGGKTLETVDLDACMGSTPIDANKDLHPPLEACIGGQSSVSEWERTALKNQVAIQFQDINRLKGQTSPELAAAFQNLANTGAIKAQSDAVQKAAEEDSAGSFKLGIFLFLVVVLLSVFYKSQLPKLRNLELPFLAGEKKGRPDVVARLQDLSRKLREGVKNGD